jgi:hypothetical protein
MSIFAKVKVTLAMVVAVTGLSGCNTLGDVVNDRIAQNQKCADLLAYEKLPDFDFSQDILIAKLGQVARCPADLKPQATANIMPLCELDALDAKYEGQISEIKSAAVGLKQKLKELQAHLRLQERLLSAQFENCKRSTGLRHEFENCKKLKSEGDEGSKCFTQYVALDALPTKANEDLRKKYKEISDLLILNIKKFNADLETFYSENKNKIDQYDKPKVCLVSDVAGVSCLLDKLALLQKNNEDSSTLIRNFPKLGELQKLWEEIEQTGFHAMTPLNEVAVISSTVVETRLGELRSCVGKLPPALKEKWASCERGVQSVAAVGNCMAVPLRDSASVLQDAFKEVQGSAHALEQKVLTLSGLPDELRKDVEVLGKNTAATIKGLSDILLDNRLFIKDVGRNYFVHHAARKMMNSLHQSLKRVDAKIDKLDDKAYGVITAGNFLFQKDLRRVMRDPIDKAVNQYLPKGTYADQTIRMMLVEMGKAACERTEKELNPSIMADLVDDLIIDVAQEKLDDPDFSKEKARKTDKSVDVSKGGKGQSAAATVVQPPPVPNGAPLPLAVPPALMVAMVVPVAPVVALAGAGAGAGAGAAAESSPKNEEVSALAYHQAHEWLIRKTMLENAAEVTLRQQAEQASLNYGETKPRGGNQALIPRNAIDEEKVRLLADIAAAPAIAKAGQSPLADGQLRLPGLEINSLEVQRNVTQAIAIYPLFNSVKVNVSNQNSFAPNFSPVISVQNTNVPTNFCNQLQGLNVLCANDGVKYIITPRINFNTFEPNCSAKDGVAAQVIADLAKAAQAYGKNHNLSFSAQVDGYASSKHADQLCQANIRSKAWACSGWPLHEAFVNNQSDLRFVSSMSAPQSLQFAKCEGKHDGNWLLGMARASWVAQKLEHESSGRIRPRVNSFGAQFANKFDQQTDRMVRIELTPHLAPGGK